MPVAPYYIVVVSCPDHITADEFELVLPIRGFIAAKHTSRDSWRGCRQRADFAWTKVTGGIRCCPALVQDWERVNDTDDGWTARRMGNSEIFRYVWNSVGIHQIADRAAKENIRL